MSRPPRIPFPAKTPLLFLAALLAAGAAAHAQSETASLSRSGGPNPVQKSLDGTAENHRAVVIEAHIDTESEQQPTRQKRIRVLRSSENFDDAEVDALVERLVKKYGSSEPIDSQIELETIEEIELSDIDTNVFITRGEDLDTEHGDVVHFMARADGPGMPPKGGFRWRRNDRIVKRCLSRPRSAFYPELPRFKQTWQRTCSAMLVPRRIPLMMIEGRVCQR